MQRGILLMFVLVLLPLGSAEILMSTPEDVYSIGDPLNIDVTLKPNSQINNFLTVNIVCGTESVEIYKSPFNLDSGQEQIVVINNVLSKTIIGALTGNCFLSAVYGNENAQSQSFDLSDDITIGFDLDKNKFNPSEKIAVTGTAVKTNGQNANGFVDVVIESLDVLVSKTVTDGTFSINFTIPDDAQPGQHSIKIRVYEKETSGEIKNEGESSENLEVNSVLQKIEIITNKLDILPKETLEFNVHAYDQAGNEMEKDVEVTIYEPGDFEYSNTIIKSNTVNTLNIESNFTPGYWKVDASLEGVSAKKLFYVEEHEEVIFSLLEDNLIMTNTGNVVYNKPVEVLIGSSTEIVQADLDVGETKKYQLHAPDGDYQIGIKEDGEEVVLGNGFLTGRAIGVEEVSSGIIKSVGNPLFWFLGILLLLLIIVYLHIRRVKKDNKEPAPAALDKKQAVQNYMTGNVNSGKKEEASVIAIKATSTGYGAQVIDNMLAMVKNSGAKIYVEGEYKIVLFSPILTKNIENNVTAIALAKRIENTFKEHNVKFKDKINFGIGVHTGSIISEVNMGNFNFTSVDNFIGYSKNVSNKAYQETLISEDIRKKTVTKVTADKAAEGLYRVRKIAER